MSSGETFVLVHGAWHGGWCWDTLAGRLRDLGHTARVVEQLPSAGPNPVELGDLRADADVVRAELDAAENDGGVVLVGHSYGGMVISEVAGHPAVRHAVYLTAAFPEKGESLFGLFGTEADWVAPGPDGTLRIVEDRQVDVFYHDCEPAVAKEAAARLVYQSLASAATPSTSTGWGATPTTYVVATEDRVLSREVQQGLSKRASHTVEIAASHSPFLSMPGPLAGLLTDIAAGH